MLYDINTAVVGCGNWGKNHVRNFARLSNLIVCCDRNQQCLSRATELAPSVSTTLHYSEVLSDSGVEAVVLATPATRHAEMAVQALRAGKHVLVEKPLALSGAAAEEVLNVAKEAGRVLMVGHLMEYHPGVEKMKDLLDSGSLGRPYYMYSHRVNLGTVRTDESAMWSLAPHDVSMMNWLLGEEPEEVNAHGASYLRPGIEDVVFVHLRYPSGAVGHVHVSWLDPRKERMLTVVGRSKMAIFDDMSANEKVRVYDKGAVVGGNGGVDGRTAAEVYLRDGDVVIPALPHAEPLAREVEEFLRCVEEGDVPRSDGHDGLRVVRTLERAQKALDSRREAGTLGGSVNEPSIGKDVGVSLRSEESAAS